MLSCFEWDWANSRAAFETALHLDEDNATTHQWFSIWFLAQDQDDNAVSMSRRAEALGPASLMTAVHSAWILHLTGRFDDAIAKLTPIVQRNRYFWRGYFNLALSLAATDQIHEAADAAELAVALNDYASARLVLAHVYARMGQRERASSLLERSDHEYMSPYWQAYAYAGLGDQERALDALCRSVQDREWFLLFLKHEPAFQEIRHLPRFGDVCRQIGLP